MKTLASIPAKRWTSSMAKRGQRASRGRPARVKPSTALAVRSVKPRIPPVRATYQATFTLRSKRS
jgi:hypothetical protein